MQSIDDLQDRINEQTGTKLKKYVDKDTFQDADVLLQGLLTRVQTSETTLKKQVNLLSEQTQNIDNFRKRLQKFQGDFEMLRRKTASALEMSSAAANKEEGIKMEDLAGLELSGDGAEQMTKMVQLLEQNLNRRIAIVEAKANTIADLEDQISRIQSEGVNAKPGEEQSSGATPE